MHSLNTSQQNTRATKRLKAEHGPDDALDGLMNLLDDVVQILHLTQFNRRAGIGLNTFDDSGVGTTLVNGGLVGQAVLTDARSRKRRAAARSCLAVSRKSTVAPSRAAAR